MAKFVQLDSLMSCWVDYFGHGLTQMDELWLPVPSTTLSDSVSSSRVGFDKNDPASSMSFENKRGPGSAVVIDDEPRLPEPEEEQKNR